MKQSVVFLLCWTLNEGAFLNQMGSAWKIGLWLIYFWLSFPVIITHVLPFAFAYCWILAAMFCMLVCRLMCWMEGSSGNEKGNKVNMILKIMAACSFYFFLLLWPIATMSRLYDGNNYIYSLYSVYADRRTSDYIQEYIGEYHSITQWMLWFL